MHPYWRQAQQVTHFLYLYHPAPFLAQNIPDTDGPVNKTDPYLRVKVAGNPTKKTPTIKGSLNPVFTEDNSWLFTGGVGTWVEVICMDWDPESRDDVVVKVGGYLANIMFGHRHLNFKKG